MEFAKLHLGLVLVIVGVAGEGIEIIWKLLVRKRSERLDLFLDSIGAFFWIVLVIGLALEIPDAARTDKEAAESNKLAGQANERAANTESNNLVLRSNVAVLESNVQWRTINPRQEFFLTNSFASEKILAAANHWVSLLPTTNEINVITESTDIEACWYAGRLANVLNEGGFNAVLQFRINIPGTNGPFVGLGFIVKTLIVETNGPFSMFGDAGRIFEKFQIAEIYPTAIEVDTNLARAGDIVIVVGHKPEIQEGVITPKVLNFMPNWGQPIFTK
ncbi:MAG TPA: hypothetical protein VHX90_05555 [Verrucomicrobiae bacterium]|jgi:hypothetical protein|nr:hypothetical protein [Verrucomicrobiae bacterium]